LNRKSYTLTVQYPETIRKKVISNSYEMVLCPMSVNFLFFPIPLSPF